MTALVLWACLTGTNCPPFVITDTIESQFACMFGGQAEIAKFMADRPNWRVEKFTCAPAEKVAEFLGANEA